MLELVVFGIWRDDIQCPNSGPCMVEVEALRTLVQKGTLKTKIATITQQAKMRERTEVSRKPRRERRKTLHDQNGDVEEKS